ncbi:MULTISPECIES: VOC family protein [Rheinheimera]|uniref:VOC family protein n=1 Tax=Rheinheimera marina TaxID=1774958 RepID=A0ABV9JJS2_9GAMM
MTLVNPVGWFEIPVTDLDRACAFYQQVFSIQLGRMQMGEGDMATFPFDHQANGAAGALVKEPGYHPSITGALVYFACQDVSESLARVVNAGGQVALVKTGIGEHGFIGHFIDSEGNKVALHSIK